jgi:hypothetical protein
MMDDGVSSFGLWLIEFGGGRKMASGAIRLSSSVAIGRRFFKSSQNSV